MTIVGARPQFMKAAPLSRALRERHSEILVHTGQHYDESMSQVFFDELGIPKPDYNLAIGSGLQGEQTGNMLARLEGLMLEIRPDWVIVMGDTNSTLAGALAASKLKQPLAHVEAGVRSFNRWNMPEEVNRVLTDHVSDLLLAPSSVAVNNLRREGIGRNVEIVGDVMVDVLYDNLEKIRDRVPIREGPFCLMTCHRQENTDDAANLGGIVEAVNRSMIPVVFPLHPRTKKALDRFGLRFADRVELIDPVGYLDMITLLRDSNFVITDSGGLVREAYLMGKWCIYLRTECEWEELVNSGWCYLAGSDPDKIASALNNLPAELPATRENYYGDGCAAAKIVDALERHLNDARNY